MLNNMSYLSIFFRLFNFVIIIYIFVYLFKKYLKDGLYKEIKDRIQYLKNLNDEKVVLIKNMEQLDIEIIEQNKLTKELINKLNRWKLVLNDDQEKKIKKLDSIKIDIQNKQLIRNDSLSKKIVYSLVIPEIVKENQIEILQEFSNNKESIKYEKEIIEFIKKSL